MLGKLERAGHEITQEIENSDLVLVNTCAVKRTTLNRVIYRLEELKNSNNREVIVGGCLPLIDLEKIEDIGEFSGIISCLNTDRITEMVERISEGESGVKMIEGDSGKPRGQRYKKSKMSAPIAIAEGCLSDCSYCCVKFARGKLQSFEPRKVVKEVENEVTRGRKEIYITAQDTAAYGLDIKTNLPELLQRITSMPEKFRVRVGMMNPSSAKRITDDLIDAYRDSKIYKFLHLPIQSGNDKVLEEMRRNYKVQEFKEIYRLFWEEFPDLYLATDIIVGFPGESKEDFKDTCELLKEVRPDKVNLTRFTPMPGTDAKQKKQIRSEEKKRRSKKITELQREISLDINKEYVGKEFEGLVIKEGKKGGYEARIENYKPVIVENTKPGKFIKIKITEARPTYLMGEIKE